VPERILHLEAGYIYADLSFVKFKPLVVWLRTMQFRQSLYLPLRTPGIVQELTDPIILHLDKRHWQAQHSTHIVIKEPFPVSCLS